MQTFERNDQAYLDWLATFPQGYVVNSGLRPRASYLVLHRATCKRIKQLNRNARHWTVGYAKRCSTNASELHAWADGRGGVLAPCKACKP
jgi:hypothetical protein